MRLAPAVALSLLALSPACSTSGGAARATPSAASTSPIAPPSPIAAPTLSAPGVTQSPTAPPVAPTTSSSAPGSGSGFPVPLAATGSTFDGLNLLLTRQRLQEIEAAVTRGDPLATKAVADVIATANGYLTATPNPIQGVFQVPGYYTSLQAVQQQITAQIRGDGRAAHALAWGYALTGQQSYADASKKFIFAWVGALTTPVDGQGASGLAGIEDLLLGEGGGDTALVTHYSFPLFLYAFDILNGFGQITSAESASLQQWLAPFIAYRLSEETFPNNHLDWQVLFLGVAAHVTANQNLMDTAVAYYRDGMAHQSIAADGGLWRELARGEKAATYTVMALEAKVQFDVIAKNHGVPGLETIVAGARSPATLDSIELEIQTGFKSSGVASAGGTLENALDSLRDFVNGGAPSWSNWQNTIQSSVIDGPANPSDWGWLFEAGYAFFQDPTYLPLMQSAPYGLQPDRVYTLGYATLVFHAF
jgi:hypothetical protein